MFLVSTYSNEIKITSDHLEINRDNKTSIFFGNVYAYNQDLKIWADKLIIKFNESENDIHQIDAKNDVKIVKEGITATGDEGVYYPKTDQINLYGNVEIHEKNNFVKCDELTIDISNSTSIMKSNSSERVEAFIISN